MTEEIKNATQEQVQSAPVEHAEGTQEVSVATPVAQPASTDGKMQNMLIGVIAVLVVMAAIQVFQTQQLMAAVSNGSINTGAQTQESAGAGLQSQVGGCG